MSKKLFDICIGNPPYNSDFNNSGDNGNFAKPVYNEFMDAVFPVSDKVELIHPARFLFNAGSTPKLWNEKMLADPHFKVLHYEEDATKVFANTDIKGGVVISYRDESNDYGPIEIFTKYDELNTILKKIIGSVGFAGLSGIVVSRTAYRLTPKLHEDFPNAINQLSKGHAFDMSTNIFDRLPQVFCEADPDDGVDYARILGRLGNSRVYRFIRRDYINDVVNFEKFKLLLPKANGAGHFGEIISQPLVAEPFTGNTETFISVGNFETSEEADNCMKYIKCKFTRALLGVLKTTQDLTPDKWKYVPLQDFTAASDIDWMKSIHEIDLQLYRKYNLSKEEIDFIETNVKEMV